MSFLRRAFSSGGSPQGGTMFAGSTLFDFVVPDKDGKDVSLACYKGKRCYLVVNVASQCGLTATNYAELSQLYEKHSSAGLEILAFPSNEFGAQEPGTNEEIQCFARDRGAKYPVFGKVKVNGKDALPLYQWLKSEKVRQAAAIRGI